MPRSHAAVVHLAVLGLSLVARAEARQPDVFAPTAGYTSLPFVIGEVPRLTAGSVEVHLLGEHATLTARYRFEAPLGPSARAVILAGLGKGPDAERWPGAPRKGHFPSLVWGPDPANLAEPALRSLPPEKAPPAAQLSPAQMLAHRWPVSGQELTVVWTVPYAGDTYFDRRPRDCSCGEPWNFAIHLTSLFLDLEVVPGARLAAGSSKVGLTVRNGSGFTLRLVAPGEPAGPGAEELADGGVWTRDVTLGAGQKPSHLRIDLMDPASKEDNPKSRLSFLCLSPHETPAGHLEGEDYTRALDVANRAAARRVHQYDCERSGQKLPPLLLPGFLWAKDPGRPENFWSDEQRSRFNYFARGLFREQMNPRGRRMEEGWAWLAAAGGRTLPAGNVAVSASATLENEERYGAGHLLDGDPDTAWCARPEKRNVAAVTLRWGEAREIRGLALLPGMVKADWAYEANAAPEVVDAEWTLAGGAAVRTRATLALPASAELFREGRRALWIAAPEGAATGVTLRFARNRKGLFSRDLCASEVTVLAK